MAALPVEPVLEEDEEGKHFLSWDQFKFTLRGFGIAKSNVSALKTSFTEFNKIQRLAKAMETAKKFATRMTEVCKTDKCLAARSKLKAANAKVLKTKQALREQIQDNSGRMFYIFVVDVVCLYDSLIAYKRKKKELTRFQGLLQAIVRRASQYVARRVWYKEIWDGVFQDLDELKENVDNAAAKSNWFAGSHLLSVLGHSVSLIGSIVSWKNLDWEDFGFVDGALIGGDVVAAVAHGYAAVKFLKLSDDFKTLAAEIVTAKSHYMLIYRAAALEVGLEINARGLCVSAV